MTLMRELITSIQTNKQSIVFPEAIDERVLSAASRLYAEDILTPILIGAGEDIKKTAEENELNIEGITSIDPEEYEEIEKMVEAFVERRNGKVSPEEAREILKDMNYFGTMLVYMGKADGMVSGAIHSTSDTVRPAFQIIKPREGVSVVSGSFIMTREDERYVFADCGINPDPNEQQLAEIAVESARVAEAFDIKPAKVAMLSYSTHGSAGGPSVDKVVNATKIAQEAAPEFDIDGELQFDAALVESVGKSKAPDSNVAGQANVFIFPDLQSGNIGYKIAQRFGGFNAIGPLLQGLNKPINDLSRGCSAEDVYQIAIVTAQFALMNEA
ncbi:MAG: phosphate acetyltransferase [Atopococcus tabaci]|uniref:Phosphate acetyltransferase n=1 Tax=Atopococcus tabaci TaxID=269774 RepID=A0AA43UBU0_9LACT|nr:phosphate acetyltransferase [Atopococcus tabaci]